MGITNRHTQSIVVGQCGITTQLILPDREIGGVDLCTADLVNARSLLEKNT